MRIIDLFKNPFEPHKTPGQVLFSVIVLCFLILPLTSIFVFFTLQQNNLDSRASNPISGFSEQRVAAGISSAVAMQFAPDGRLFVLQQNGVLRVIKNGALLSQPFLSIGVQSDGERGLLGIAFDPRFGDGTNNWVYIYHTTDVGGIHNRVSRVKPSATNPDVADMNTMASILDLNGLSGATNHNGGAIHFGNDGKLYVAVGENANSANSQNVGNRLGKILRINSDGSIPSDNPTSFTTSSGVKTTTAENKAIYAIGFRNPFTFDVDEKTGKIFINDVGDNPPVRFEEINELVAGANYGWGAGCQGTTCNNATYKNPVYSYDPGTQGGCAITGGTFYNPTNPKYPADYVGDYLFADYCGGWIRRIEATGGSAQAFTSPISSPVDLKVSPDGDLYYLARGSGEVFKIVYNQQTHPDIDPNAKTIACEAENANPLTAPMAKGQDTAASYVYLNAASNVGDTLPTTTGYAEYNFNVQTAGTYAFWTKTNYADSSSNSFWIQFNNQNAINKYGNDNIFGKWHWINYSDGDGTPQVIKVSLLAGPNKLRIYGREQNAKLDKWILTTDTLFGPSDSYVGPAQNCVASTNLPPVPVISTPAEQATYKHSTTVPIAFSGTATDPEDGALPASAFTWKVDFGHDTHFHPHLQEFSGVKNGTFMPNFSEPADNVYYRITLKVVDSGGAVNIVYRDVMPQKSTLTLGSSPAAAKIKLDSANVVTAPYQFLSVVGYPRPVEAVSPQTIASKNYEFFDWSDAGTQAHSILTPATNTTYTARFAESNAQPIIGQFKGEYFNNKTLTGTPIATVNTNSINYNWTGSPTAGVNADNFSVRWSGRFNFDGSRYRVNAKSDDGVRIFVDGVKVDFVRHPNPGSTYRERPIAVDGWKDQGPTVYNALISPTAGVHDVVVEYYESINGAVAQLNWVHHLTCFDMNADGQVGRPDMDVMASNYGALGLSPWDINVANSANTIVNSGDQAKLANKYGTSCN